MALHSIRWTRAAPALALLCLSPGITLAQTATSRVVSAANTLLSTLDDKQRQSVLFGSTTKNKGRAGLTFRPECPPARA